MTVLPEIKQKAQVAYPETIFFVLPATNKL